LRSYDGLKSQDLEFIFFFAIFAFFEKLTAYGKILKMLFGKYFTASLVDVVIYKCRRIFRREIGEIVRYLTDKETKFLLPLKLSLLRGSRPKYARASPDIWLTFFQISSKSVHFRRSYSRTREDCSFDPWSIFMIGSSSS